MTEVAPILIIILTIIHISLSILEISYFAKSNQKWLTYFPNYLFRNSKAVTLGLILYNFIMSIALLYSIIIPTGMDQEYMQIALLFIIIIAGVLGAIKFSKKILWYQSIPALLAYIFITLGKGLEF